VAVRRKATTKVVSSESGRVVPVLLSETAETAPGSFKTPALSSSVPGQAEERPSPGIDASAIPTVRNVTERIENPLFGGVLLLRPVP
jgi:hypothetical protein